MTEKIAIFEILTGKINLQVNFLMLSARKSRRTLRGMNTLQTAICTLEPMEFLPEADHRLMDIPAALDAIAQ